MSVASDAPHRKTAASARNPRGAGLTGCTLEIMLAGGFKVMTIGRLVRHGLASVATEQVRAGGKMIVVARVRITDAGRQALDQ